MNNVISPRANTPRGRKRMSPVLSLFLAGLVILVLTGTPAAKMKQDTDGGGGGGGTSTGAISCVALRQQVTTAYTRAGLSGGVAQAAGTRAEKECKEGKLVN